MKLEPQQKKYLIMDERMAKTINRPQWNQCKTKKQGSAKNAVSGANVKKQMQKQTNQHINQKLQTDLKKK